MCNRCNCECGCNHNWGGCACVQNRRSEGYGRCGRCDEAAWYEAERLMRQSEYRRCKEDRCAREFVRCMNCNHRNY